MTRCLWLVLFCAFGWLRSYGIEAVMSQTVFFAPKGNTLNPYVEVYWQIAPSTLYFRQPEKNSFIAQVITELTFRNDTGIIATDRFIMQTNAAASLQQAFAQNITELHRYKLPQGLTRITLTLRDAIDSNNRITLSDSFRVPSVTNVPVYSGIQLLDTSFTSAAENAFSKNGRQQVPLCASFFDQWRSTMSFYTELYNTDRLGKEEIPAVQTVFVSRRPLESPLFGLQEKDTIKPAGVLPFIGKFDISKVPTGNYYLNVVLDNKAGQRIASASLFFQRVNEIKDTAKAVNKTDSLFETLNFLDLSTTFVGKYTLPQVKAILKMIRPIATAIERDAIDMFTDRPDESYMKYFIYNFWKERNGKDPKKAWDNYANIVKEVNRMFRGEIGQGYETDRGQVYLKYGKPNDIITVNNESGVLPYEIWIYNVLPAQSLGGLFLFYRPADYISGFKLLHSNVRGEVRNTAWRSYLYTATGQSSGNSNSRAEDYFPGNK